MFLVYVKHNYNIEKYLRKPRYMTKINFNESKSDLRILQTIFNDPIRMNILGSNFKEKELKKRKFFSIINNYYRIGFVCVNKNSAYIYLKYSSKISYNIIINNFLKKKIIKINNLKFIISKTLEKKINKKLKNNYIKFV